MHPPVPSRGPDKKPPKLIKVHIAFGIASLLLPSLHFGWELVSHGHAPLLIYLLTIVICVAHAIVALSLIKRRVPAYDIPAIRGFTVSCGVVLSFVGMSLMFHDRFGPTHSYEPVGKLFSLISLYTVIYAWSDAVGHLGQHLRGDYKSAQEETAEKAWVLPYESTSYRHILLGCLVLKPTRRGLLASAAPSHTITVISVFFIAAFSSSALINLRYLVSGAEGVGRVSARYPEITRWASYNALVVVGVSSFSTFMGSMQLNKRISIPTAAALNIGAFFIPVLNVALLQSRYKGKVDVLQGLRAVITIHAYC